MALSKADLDKTRMRVDEGRDSRSAKAAIIQAIRDGSRPELDKRGLPDEIDRIATRARRLGLDVDAGGATAGDLDAAGRVLEAIVGPNNLLGVRFLIDGTRAARAVARISFSVPGGTQFGTGFMVSSRLLMTNNHVLETNSQAAAAIAEFDYFRRIAGGSPAPVVSFRLRPDLFFDTHAPLDYTIVAVETANASGVGISDRGWHPLIAESGKAVVGERLNIIQHPGGNPQQVAIHENTLHEVKDDFLHYETDTQGGSSGSPVFNDDWELVGLHHAAVGSVNEGIRISRIVARLRAKFGLETSNSFVRDLLAESGPAASLSGQPGGIDGGGIRQTGVDADGTARWVVPLNVAVRVGDGSLSAGTSRDVSGPSATGVGARTSARSAIDLAGALTDVQEASERPYYVEEEDTAACDDYYDLDVEQLNGSELLQGLGDKITSTHTTVLSYRVARLRHLYPWIDLRLEEDDSRVLRGIYTNQVFDSESLIRQEIAAEAARESALQERLLESALVDDEDEYLERLEAMFPFNCEHVVPQSWFNKVKVMKTDLHHLFTCEWSCNSFRGNRAYFEFAPEAVRDSCGMSQVGKFEPVNGKGAAARATFYFLARHPGEVADSAKEMPADRIETLKQWDRNEEPGLWELHRNAEIQKVQGNRNPFIDFWDDDLPARIDWTETFL